MTGFLRIILGLIGFVALGGGAWLYVSDGGLAFALRDRHEALYELDESDRKEVLNDWSMLIHEFVRVRNAAENNRSTRPQTQERDQPTSHESFSHPTMSDTTSSLQERITPLLARFETRLNDATSDWRAQGQTTAIEDILRDATLAFEVALEEWKELPLIDRTIVASRLEDAFTSAMLRFNGAHGSLTTALTPGSKLEAGLRELRDRKQRFNDLVNVDE